MNVKKYLFLVFIIFLLTLSSCGEQGYNVDGKTLVTFELEGGSYKQATNPVKHYYDLEQNETCHIFNINEINAGKDKVLRAGYEFGGWFKNKTDNNGIITYSNEWSFDDDKISTNGITLYAKWTKVYFYRYEVGYMDNNDNFVRLGYYDVKQGDTFKDLQGYATKRSDILCTPIGFLDESLQPWDDDYKHPGGDQDLTIRVIADYIPGLYKIIKTKDDLILASRSATSKMYLMNDIDLEGAEINFKDFKGEIVGNNYTISNFKLKYTSAKSDLVEIKDIDGIEDVPGKSLALSLFNNMKKAKIKDVSFLNFDIVVTTNNTLLTGNIYLLGIGSKLEEVELNNVTIKGEYIIDVLPDTFTGEVIVPEDGYFSLDESSTINNVVIELIKKQN